MGSVNRKTESVGIWGQTFNKHYKKYQRLGDAIIDSLSTNGDLGTIYTLLGDPALKLRQ